MTVIFSSNILSVFLLYPIKFHTGGRLLYLKVNWWAKKLWKKKLANNQSSWKLGCMGWEQGSMLEHLSCMHEGFDCILTRWGERGGTWISNRRRAFHVCHQNPPMPMALKHQPSRWGFPIEKCCPKLCLFSSKYVEGACGRLEGDGRWGKSTNGRRQLSTD